ncbi:MAG: hypothetical protein WCG16_10405 [Methylococcales bacterium]
MDEINRAATGNDGTKEIKQSYFITTIKAMLIKVSEWIKLVGVNI